MLQDGEECGAYSGNIVTNHHFNTTESPFFLLQNIHEPVSHAGLTHPWSGYEKVLNTS